ncbi:hypothetical protein [Pseudomonas viridiflava]|uniref:hypothetical protein n=1 Tax=Pseudomonas viridiflava TaxID=33069 RepID=UPI002A6A1A47|nr:hypothetical protein [Pseudomonas viridiflava]MDY0916208.1 hypothetical protein [Pseudomonas viridiflava]
MSKNSQSLNFINLPKVFESTPGEVDVALLKRICNIWPKSSSHIRGIIENFTGEKLNPKEDTYVRLSKLVFLAEFRKCWNFSRKSGFPTFDKLVFVYVTQKHKKLHFDAPELVSFYEKRAKENKRVFPVLENISVLIEQMCEPSIDKVTAALFAWSMFESCQSHLLETPEESSLQNLETALRSKLVEKKETEILELLSAGDWNAHSENTKQKIVLPEAPALNDPVFNDSIKEKQIEGVKAYVHPYHLELNSDLLEIRDAVGKLRTFSEGMAQKSGVFLVSNNINSVLEGMQEALESASGLLNIVDQKQKNIVLMLKDPLTVRYEALELTDTLFIPRLASLSGFGEWATGIESYEKDIARSKEKLDQVLSKSNRAIKELILYKKDWNSMHSAEELLDKLVHSAESIESGIQSEQELLKAVEENYKSIDWNPLLDSSLGGVWQKLGLYLIQKKSINNILGVCVRKEFELLSEEFVGLIVALLKEQEVATVLGIISVAAWLTLGQKEEVAKHNEKCVPVMALAQLQAYLNSGGVNNIDRYSYWSAYPLHDVVSNPLSLFDEFFSVLYICTVEDGSEVDVRFLTQYVAKAIIKNGEKKSSSSVEFEMQNRLFSILEQHRKGGSNTYAHIWNLAYREIFFPLYEIAEKRGLSEFVLEYKKFTDYFEIENYLAGWKQEIPEHLKKRSEYDKFIRNQVSIKMFEINDWVGLYLISISKAAYSGKPKHEGLLNKICKVLESPDSDVAMLKAWLLQLHDKKDSFQHACFEKNLDGALDAIYEIDDVSAFFPRAFLKKLEGMPVSHSDIVADLIISEVGFNTHSQLSKIYAEKKMFEAFSALTSESDEEVLPSIERIVEKDLEELEVVQQSKINSLKKRVDALGVINYEFVNSIDRAEELLNSHKWKKLERELFEIDQYLSLEEGEVLESRERCDLAARINALGGVGNINDSVSVLKGKLNLILEEVKPRRVHVERINRLGLVRNLDESLLIAVTSCIAELDTRLPYPDAQTSELLAYYFQQAVDPLSLELNRIKTLLPSYGRKLKLLTLTFLHNLSVDKKCLDEHSNLVLALIDTAEMWKDLDALGESCVDTILSVFESKGLDTKLEMDAEVLLIAPELVEKVNVMSKERNASADERFNAGLDHLVNKAKLISVGKAGVQHSNDSVSNLIESKQWLEVGTNALRGVLGGHTEHSANWLESLTDWSVSQVLQDRLTFNIAEYSACLYLINNVKNSSVVKAITPSKNMKGMIGEIACEFVAQLLEEVSEGNRPDGKATLAERIQTVSGSVDLISQFSTEFTAAFTVKGNGDSIAMRSLWDYFSGDARQAEARAAFMNIAWRLHCPAVIAACLSYSPIDMERRRSLALADIANRALVDGKHELLQGFVDLRKSIQAKPFQLFVEMVMRQAPIHTENQAQLSMAGNVEFVSGGVLRGILNIIPRKMDCPDLISILLSPTAPIRFKGGDLKLELIGPFFSDASRSVEFEQLDENAEQFRIEVDCESTSITGSRAKFSQVLEFKIAGREIFQPLAPDFIDDAFDSFPEQQMRYEDYVPRAVDEQKIEKALFNSKVVRSLWISSPRRSGKTSMLYRILDSFSHKVGRDNFVIYLTVDESFMTGIDFNKWIWKRVCSIIANKELRERFSDFDAMGKRLSFDADAGTFIGQLSDLLMENGPQGNRVIFLIDEIDRFAAMFFEGGSRRKLATDILWQIRHFIAERRDIGIVFAGSSAAREVFISNPESPFFNSIEHLELSPFSTRTKQQEVSSRQIIEPGQIRYRHVISKESLEHLVWVCSGIPYYMKLVAGATYAVATQSHILVSDVNAGLRALLSKSTGVSKLDDMGGDPGADDLRTTVTLERNSDGVLVRAVLYAVADLHSPISGHRVLRGRVSSRESKLSQYYRLPKEMIERGIEICLKLGLLKLAASESSQELFFAIPILGESLRNSSARHWALVDHELSAISSNVLEGTKQ